MLETGVISRLRSNVLNTLTVSVRRILGFLNSYPRIFCSAARFGYTESQTEAPRVQKVNGLSRALWEYETLESRIRH